MKPNDVLSLLFSANLHFLVLTGYLILLLVFFPPRRVDLLILCCVVFVYMCPCVCMFVRAPAARVGLQQKHPDSLPGTSL